MSMRHHLAQFSTGLSLALVAWSPLSAQAQAGNNYQIFVSNEKSADVTVINGSDLKVVGTIPVGKRPWGITLSPDGKYLFSANGPSDDISVVDLATEKEIARVKSPGSPWGIVAVPDAK